MVSSVWHWTPIIKLLSLLDFHTQISNTIAHLQKISVDEGSFRAPVEFYFFAVNYSVKHTKKVSKKYR